jgi:hypothetical protein
MMRAYRDPSAGADGGNIVLKAGQILYDNDPRYRGRKLEVVRVEGSYGSVCAGHAK